MAPRISPWKPMVAAFCLSALTVLSAVAGEVQPIAVRPPVSLVAAGRVYWIGSGASAAEAVALREALLAAGARHVNLFVPDMVIVCEVPPAAARDVDALSKTTRFRPSNARVQPAMAAGASWEWIVDSYALADRVARGDGAAALAPATDDPDGFRDVVFTLPPERVDEIQRRIDGRRARDGAAPRPAMARRVNQNSEILSGGILANFVYPESNGQIDLDTETWSDEDLRQARAGATAAFLSWQGKYPNMDISYVIHHVERVPTTYEPIRHDMNSDGLWITDAMHSLGWGLDSTDPSEIVHEFNESERTTWHMQWVVTSFIASSRNTPSHRFGGGTADYTAYAYLGGPFMVEPFPAGGDPNEIGETLVYSQIVQHEIGHLFWTLDEYRGSPFPCSARSGYLDVENANVTMVDPGGEEVRCIDMVPCLMHSAARLDQGRPWCDWSEGHLGVYDGNGNGIPDIFEADPVITFVPEGPETVTTNEYVVRFRAHATAVPNMNPYQRPEERVSYALPLDGGRLLFGNVQINLKALDGSWNEIEEEAEFHMDVPQAGQQMQITAQVVNEAGYRSPPATKMVYFAGIRYDRLIARPKWNRIELSWETIGETFGATYDVYRLKEGQAMPGALLASDVTPAGTGTGGQPLYRVHDFEVEPGERYRYYIEGVFQLQLSSGTREVRSQSDVVEQTAMVAMTSGEMISHVAPNPTRGAVVFSFAVPQSYQNTPRGQERIPTDVEVGVYDVRGQLTRRLQQSSELESVLTMTWDGTNQDGTPAPSGIYFVRVKAGDTQSVRKVVLLR